MGQVRGEMKDDLLVKRNQLNLDQLKEEEFMWKLGCFTEREK